MLYSVQLRDCTMIFGPETYASETAARKALEAIRWPNGPVCHHCGEAKRRYQTKREGRYRCGNPKCRKDFTVMTGTVMERSHVPPHKWLEAYAIMCESKKGVSSLQLQRHLKISYKAAWFLSHRVREAMREGGLEPPPMLSGGGKIVEADETYYGPTEKHYVSPQRRGRPYAERSRGPRNKRPIVSLVERGGSVRSFHVPVADAGAVAHIVRENIHQESRLHTDESNLYFAVGKEFAKHETIKHRANEYVRGDVTTNTVENYFSVFKRGMRGTYQHCKEKHLHRYLAEFDFRYNNRVALGINDGERAALAIRGAEGKRLTYRWTH
jgi:transposase-like protein